VPVIDLLTMEPNTVRGKLCAGVESFLPDWDKSGFSQKHQNAK
jgi:hypothetical protein